MRHAVALSGQEDDQVTPVTVSTNPESTGRGSITFQVMKLVLWHTWSGIRYHVDLLRPSTLRRAYQQCRQMTLGDLVKSLARRLWSSVELLLILVLLALR